MSRELQKSFAEKKELTFSQVFETAVDSIACDELNFPTGLLQELKEKRELGIKKYGDTSFQASLSNFLNSSCLQHADEELTDCLNYLLSACYQWRISGEFPIDSSYAEIVRNLLNTVADVKLKIQQLMAYQEDTCAYAKAVEEDVWTDEPAGGKNHSTQKRYIKCERNCSYCREEEK